MYVCVEAVARRYVNSACVCVCVCVESPGAVAVLLPVRVGRAVGLRGGQRAADAPVARAAAAGRAAPPGALQRAHRQLRAPADQTE